jgi:hypothetical protein
VAIGDNSISAWEVSLISQTALVVGNWYHIAVTRESNNTFGLWINGSLEGSSVWSGTIYINSSPLWLGVGRDGSSAPLMAYIDDFRLTKGVSRYSVPNLTSPDSLDVNTKLLLNFNGSDGSTTFTDSSFNNQTVSVVGNASISTTQKMFGTASGYFDGTGDYLTVPYNLFNFQTDFTIDFWIRPSSINACGLLTFRNGGNYTTPFVISLSNNGNISVLVSSTSTWGVNVTSSIAILTGVWNHIVIQRTSNDFEIYINGFLDTRTTATPSVNAPTLDLKIGYDPGQATYAYHGYMDDLRMVDGVSSLNRNFTTPTTAYSDNGYKTTLLLHFEGSDGSTNIIDECGHSVGAFGNAALSTAQSKFGSSSAYFDGTGDYFVVAITPDIRLGNNFDHTIEMWVYPTVNSGTYKSLFHVTGGGLFFRNNTFLWYESAGARCTSASVSLNEWHHVAVIRVGTTIDLYVDGVKSASSYTSVLYYNPANIYIGCNSSGTEPFTGYIDEVRYVRGQAYYTGNFAPPSSPLSIDSSGDAFYPDTVLLLHMEGANDSTTFTDVKGNSITAFGDARLKTSHSKFGSSSAYFDGTGDYIRVPYSSAFDLSSKDFSIEAWIYPLSVSGTQCIVAKDGSGSFDWCIAMTSSTLICYTNNSASNLTVSVPPFQTNTWYHVALVRTNGYNMFYVNGVMYGWNTISITNAATSYFTIGCSGWHSPVNHFTGYIDELRITRNVYQHLTYLNPSSEKTLYGQYWANTVLMIPFYGSHGSTTFLDWKGKSITPFGNTSISSTQSKYGGTSGYFDGTGDYLRIEDHVDLNFGSGDFTIEFYVYFNSLAGSYIGLIQKRWNYNSQNSYVIYYDSTNKLTFQYSFNGTSYSEFQNLNDSALQTGVWYHLAFVRNGAYFDTYINGFKQSTTRVLGSNTLNNSTQPLIIGNLWQAGTLIGGLNGYIDHLKITKGVALYTESFSSASYDVPTEPFPTDSTDTNWANVVLLLPFDEMSYFKDITNLHNFASLGNVEINNVQSKFGGRSARFKGTGYLTTPHREDINFSGDFTIEGWIRPESVTGIQIILRKPDDTVTYPYPAYEIRLNGTNIEFTAYKVNSVGNEIFLNQSFGTVALNTWSHFAIVRFGNTWKGFLDGVAGWTGTNSFSHYTTDQNTLPLVIGGDSVNRLYGLYGYLDDLRITRNVARYSDTFTPPASAHYEYGDGDSLGAIYPGIHIRFNAYNGLTTFFDEKGHALTVNGSATLSTTQSKWGGISGYFNGSSYLSTPYDSALNVGTGDFTIEAWVYVTADTLQNAIYANGATTEGLYFSLTASTRTLRLDVNAYNVTSTSSVDLNTWTHIAVSKVGNTIYFFKNGVLDATSGSTADTGNTSGEIRIGRGRGSSTHYFTGYIDDFRFTKGIARYTATFTAPNKPYPAFSGNPFADYEVIHLPLSGIAGHTSPSYVDIGPTGYPLTAANMSYSSTIMRLPRNGYPAYFNGTTAKLTFVPLSTGTVNTGTMNFQKDWVIEFWMYPTAVGTSTREILTVDGSAGVHFGHGVQITSASKLGVFFAKTATPTTATTAVSTTSITANVWTHVKIQKLGLMVQIYLNGALDSSTFLTEQPYPPVMSRTAYIGCYYNSTEFYSGYLQDFVMRYTQSPNNTFSNLGYALTTSSRTPLLQSSFNENTFVDAIGNAYTVNGNSVISTSDKKFGANSAYFTGSSDYVTISPLSNFAHYDRDFIIEMWLKTTETASGEQVIFKQVDSDSNRQIIIKFNDAAGDHVLSVNVGDPVYNWVTTTLTKTDFSTAFRHLQVEKRSKHFAVFVDGICYGYNSIDTGPVQSRFYDNTLLHFNGSDASTTFTDSGPAAKTYTASGNARIRTANSKFGGASGYFDGTGDYITSSSSADFALGTGNFTIEFWFNIEGDSAVSSNSIKEANLVYIVNYLKIGLIGSASVTGTGITVHDAVAVKDIINHTFLAALSKNTWYHLAVTKENTVVRVFLDGVLLKTAIHSTALGASATTMRIGCQDTSGGLAKFFNGYIDEFRISKLCRFSKEFSVMTVPYKDSGEYYYFSAPSSLRIGGDGSNGFKGYIDNFEISQGDMLHRYLSIPDQSIPVNSFDCLDTATSPTMSTNKNVVLTDELITVDGISKQNRMMAYFNGNAQIQIEKGPDELFEYDDFTIEMWVYHLDTGSDRTLLTSRTGAGYTTLVLHRNPDGTVSFYITRTGSNWATISTPAQSIYTWYHIAIVRNKETISMYQNGALVGSYDIGTGALIVSSWGSSYLHIGSSDASYYFYGYMKDLQIIRGYAKYTTSFTPSTAPLTLIQIDYYNKPLRVFAPVIISHYRLGDTESTLVDCDGGWDLTPTNPSDIILNQSSLVPYNDSKDDSILFDGGYGSGPSQNVTGKTSLSFNFFIKTTNATGIIIEKSGAYLIEIESGKVRATFNLYGGGTITSTSATSINDNEIHQITVVLLSTNLLEITIDGVLDSQTNTGVSETIYKNTELLFNGASSTTMLQLRCNELVDDCKNVLYTYGAVEPDVINDSPFGTHSFYFNGGYHIEVPKLHIAKQQSLIGAIYPSAIDFTIEFWVKPFMSGISYNPLISWGAPGSSTGTATGLRGGFAISLNSNIITIAAGNLSLGGALAFYSKKGTVSISTNSWTHIAVTCKNNFIRLYQNGSEQTLAFVNFASYPSNSLVNCNVYTTDALNIGGANWNFGALGGGQSTNSRAAQIAIDDIRITRGDIYG